MSVSDRQLANAKKLFEADIIEASEDNTDSNIQNKYFIIGKPYIVEWTRATDSYYCKGCQGWLNCSGPHLEKTCKHVEAVKMWRNRND